jgi:hypothetical protein
MDQEFTPEQIETLKIIIGVLLIIPVLFLVRFIIYLILPRGVLRLFIKKKGFNNKQSLKKEKKFYED